MFVVCCVVLLDVLIFVVCRSLFVVCRLSFVACGLLLRGGVRCLLSVVCGLLSCV